MAGIAQNPKPETRIRNKSELGKSKGVKPVCAVWFGALELWDLGMVSDFQRLGVAAGRGKVWPEVRWAG